MKYIPCSIDILHTIAEDYWEISVPCEYASEAALEFAALHLGRAEKILFSNKTNFFTITSDSVALRQRTISADPSWLEAVWCLFLDTHRNGWSDKAHIDQDFSDASGILSITIRMTC